MLDILIPTFNRKKLVVSNVKYLQQEIKRYELDELVNIIVSDNCSDDGTYEAIEAHRPVSNIELLRQEKNVGLENNALSLLNASSSDYIMYIGDDDLVPEGYLKEVVDKLIVNSDIGLVIPGISAKYFDDSEIPVRGIGQKEYLAPKGFNTQMKYAYLTHQLSGCVFKREGLYKAYQTIGNHKNIYPFIFFALKCQEKYCTLYLPEMKVTVLEGNKKDWAYNQVGLLDEIAKNYNSVFGNNCFKVSLCLILICTKQSWRLRTNSFFYHLTALFSIFRNSELCLFFKIMLVPAMLPFLMKNTLISTLKKTK